ncbi:MAG: sensor histidine kinase [Ornithinimicrobium sp.]|uniref:sensor histidine kinase n=1 Tax=Ornithinimicrobium sp. TaxID=1977084 RepID=UPI0026DFDD50|nr:sensor histidine kinase [Ornithinimicrobium sp.]MDO5740003.1 sensor histidine kinase [Ornithinimicrobium sp.]
MSASTAALIRRLALVQHVLFLVLLTIGVGRSLATHVAVLPLLLSTVLLLGWYAVGARRAAVRPLGTRLAAVQPLEGASVSTRPATGAAGQAAHATSWHLARPGAGGWWLLGLVGCWLLAAAVSPENVWIAFSLWLLAGHLLPLRLGGGVSLLILAVVIARQWDGGLNLAQVVGPAVGMVFALALSRGQQLLVHDGVERERLLISLVAAQEEAEVLHTELAQAQRAAGVLEERTRLSRDIHDTLAQGFSSILLLSRAGAATQDPAAGRRLLGQIETSAADGLEEARRLVGALAPAPLESGLADALRRLVARMAQEAGVGGEVRVEGDVTALPPVVEVALLRVAQSALANVRQHSDATKVVLTLAEAEDSVRLDIVDDGRGFDLATIVSDGEDVSRGGYGLRASRQRLRELGGGLDVESEPGGGTAISASVPLTWVAPGDAAGLSSMRAPRVRP